jgi:hypothetical protein
VPADQAIAIIPGKGQSYKPTNRLIKNLTEKESSTHDKILPKRIRRLMGKYDPKRRGPCVKRMKNILQS